MAACTEPRYCTTVGMNNIPGTQIETLTAKRKPSAAETLDYDIALVYISEVALNNIAKKKRIVVRQIDVGNGESTFGNVKIKTDDRLAAIMTHISGKISLVVKDTMMVNIGEKCGGASKLKTPQLQMWVGPQNNGKQKSLKDLKSINTIASMPEDEYKALIEIYNTFLLRNRDLLLATR